MLCVKLLTYMLFSLAAFAQTAAPPTFPAHSVNGDFTIDLADISIPVPYGTPKTMVAVSICSARQFNQVQVGIASADGVGEGKTLLLAKSQNGYCGTFTAAMQAATVAEIDIDATTSLRLTPPKDQSATASTK